ncbi:hypothetical protein I553_2180 [Mycobacterium xenopi 4042]|uniref:Uncharacterized protein n=1 Tax=Mycobacterium xenopi 4042 TaxID=1299334 RepID=X8DK16_MYCXE|nr:hypothetical protein I553_2180 [Mycobacterium xenopi 4042]
MISRRAVSAKDPVWLARHSPTDQSRVAWLEIGLADAEAPGDA